MNAKKFFDLQLNVSFSMSELMTISSALFDSWENDLSHGWYAIAETKLEIREKLKKQLDMYYDIIK